jgi:NhaP-type Na+/H+ or K+/H+ antiporter
VPFSNIQLGACSGAAAVLRHLTDLEDEEKDETFADAHSKSYVGLLFLFFGLALGAATTHFLSRYAHKIPYTCALLVEGIVISVIHEVTNHRLGMLSESISVWIDFDPDLLMDVFLPALVFGDIMNINVVGAQRSMWECFVLACPGVLIGTCLTGVAAKYIFPYGWGWPLSLTLGAILSATDPVAVTALMKEAGVDPKLTLIIGGESLMNDGTAIVVFKLFYHLHRGNTYTWTEVTEFFLRMSVAGPCFGILFGLVARQWISWASRKEEHWDSTVQIIITICTAYLTFFAAEHTVNVSGGLVSQSRFCC